MDRNLVKNGGMIKVVLLMDMPLFPYRIYAYNELVKRGYELFVLSLNNKEEKYDIPLLFEHKRLGYNKIGPFVKIKGFDPCSLKDFKWIIITPNLRILDFYKLYNCKYWNKMIGWGHLTGRTSNNKLAEKVRYRFFKKFPALIFYEDNTRNDYINHAFDIKRLFVANNTQYVDPTTVRPNEERNYFLYVGRIQARKALDMAIQAFSKLKKEKGDAELKFVIIGGGDNIELIHLAEKEGIVDSVQFVGPVHDQKELGVWFSHALAYVSPGHVGLGVLHSFACGVPVITCSGRLHSVEISNCKPDNSLVVPFTVNDVKAAMDKIYSDKEFQRKMSIAAYNYYNDFCTIDKMVDGIDDALQYVEHLNR